MSSAMNVEVTMEACAVPTQLNFLLKKRSTNEVEVSALSQNLEALKARLEEKEKALAKHSQDFRNAVEAICERSSRKEYCEMSMFNAQEEARLAEIKATDEMRAAAAAVASGEHELQTAMVRGNDLNASIQDQEDRIAELEVQEQQRAVLREQQRLAQEKLKAERRSRAIKRFRSNQVSCTAEAERNYLLKLANDKKAQRPANEAEEAQRIDDQEQPDPAAITIHGAAMTSTTAPLATCSSSSDRAMMDDVYTTLDDEDLFQDDGAHFSAASSPGLHEVEVRNEGADVRDTSLNVPVDEPQVSGTPNEDAGRTSTTTMTERPEAAQPEAVQPEAAQTTEEAAPTVLASLQDLLASPLPKIVEWITHCLMNSPPGVAQGVLTMLHSAGGGVHIPVYKLLAVPPPADASAPTTSTAADPLPVPPPPPQQLPATTSSADSQQPPPPSSLSSSTARQQQFRSATSQPSTSAQSDQQQPPPTPVPSVSTRQPRSSDSQRASTSQCGSSATSGGCRVRVVMFSFYLFRLLAGEHNLRTLTKFQ